MIVAGGELSLMKAMISTGEDIRFQRGFQHGGNDLPIIIKSTEFFPLLWGQSVWWYEPESEM